MKRILLLSAFLFANPLGWSQTAQIGDRLELEAGLWLSTGDAEWTERGRSGDGIFIDQYRSLLEYENNDAPMLLLEASYRLTDRFSIGARYGTGSIDDADGADNDWVSGPALDREFYISRSENDLDGDTSLWDIEIKYALPIAQDGFSLDVYGSFGNYKDEFVSSNGRQVIVDESPVFGEIPGLNSTYDFDWNAITVGLEGRWKPEAASKWGIDGKIGLMPWVDYEGEAFWNLRTDFKRTPPNFVHEADGGIGFEAQIAASFKVQRVEGRLGYWYRQYEADDGLSETFFADGSSAFANLEAEANRHGLFGTFGISF